MVVVSTIDLDKEPIYTQEWMWALKGGYLDDMMFHLRNGGMCQLNHVGVDTYCIALCFREYRQSIHFLHLTHNLILTKKQAMCSTGGSLTANRDVQYIIIGILASTFRVSRN
jgi:hypothetical protein